MAGQRIGYVRVSSFDQNPDRQLEGVQVDRNLHRQSLGQGREAPATGGVDELRTGRRHRGRSQHGPAGAKSRRFAADRANADVARGVRRVR